MTYKHATLTLEEENIDFVQKTTNGEYLMLLKGLSEVEKGLIENHHKRCIDLTLIINLDTSDMIIDVVSRERIFDESFQFKIIEDYSFENQMLILVNDYDIH